MSKYILILALFLISCGGSNQEATVQEAQIEAIPYNLKISKDIKTDSFQMYAINFSEETRILCLRIEWLDENGYRDSKDLFNGKDSLSIYFPYTDLKYEVFNYNTNETIEQGVINAN